MYQKAILFVKMLDIYSVSFHKMIKIFFDQNLNSDFFYLNTNQKLQKIVVIIFKNIIYSIFSILTDHSRIPLTFSFACPYDIKLISIDTIWYCINKFCAILYEIISNLLLNDSSLDSSLGWDEVSIDCVVKWVVEDPNT